MKKRYEVTIHTHIGRLFRIDEAESEDEARAMAERGYVEEGADGDEITYETIREVEVVEVPNA